MTMISADTMSRKSTPLIDLPSFPVLTSLRVRLYERHPSRHLVDVLSFISSAPALASIDIQRGGYDAYSPTSSSTWDGVDSWLARIAKHSKVGFDTVLTLRRWAFSESYWEGLLPMFRRAGGEIRTHPDGWIHYDQVFGGPPH